MVINHKALFSYLLDDLRAGGLDTDFLLRVGVDDYWPGAASQDVFGLRLVRSFYKKFIDATSADADQMCLDKFRTVNDSCKNWRLNLNTSLDEMLFGELKRKLDDFFHPGGEPLVQSYYDLLGRGRCGPGASLGANGNDFYTKLFSSPLTCTSSRLYTLYSDYLMWFPDWVDGEISRFLHFGGPKECRASSLLFVPKSRDISRSICVEPTLNMFFQLGLGSLISDRMRSVFNIDLSIQPDVNRRLSCQGSKDGSVVTIDLSSASDSLSLGLAGSLLPEWLFDLLQELRTPFTRVADEEIELGMVSTMGNGFTFPLQTVLFSSVVDSVARIRGVSLVYDGPNRNVSVFGDDIICPSSIASEVVRFLEILGFKVNGDKSYFIGPFRESCGEDHYMGLNVRGVYLKSLTTPQDRYVAINLLNEWSARSGIYLPRCIGYLRDSVVELAIPPWENVDAGIRTPFRPSGIWDKATQRFLYRCYRPLPDLIEIREDCLRLPRQLRLRSRGKRVYNPQGLWVSFIAGYIKNSAISLRTSETRYRKQVVAAPNWCYTDPSSPFAGDGAFWRRFEDASLVNLTNDQG